MSEELHRETNAQTRALAVMVQGRAFYETMEAYWPRAREDASLPDYLREYGEIWTAKPKVLVSRTRRSADHNTPIIGGDDAIEHDGPIDVELVEQRSFEHGVAMHRYAIRHAVT